LSQDGALFEKLGLDPAALSAKFSTQGGIGAVCEKAKEARKNKGSRSLDVRMDHILHDFIDFVLAS
jgi:hypothetical protein